MARVWFWGIPATRFLVNLARLPHKVRRSCSVSWLSPLPSPSESSPSQNVNWARARSRQSFRKSGQNPREEPRCNLCHSIRQNIDHCASVIPGLIVLSKSIGTCVQCGHKRANRCPFRDVERGTRVPPLFNQNLALRIVFRHVS
jgi:hypothetical protein